MTICLPGFNDAFSKLSFGPRFGLASILWRVARQVFGLSIPFVKELMVVPFEKDSVSSIRTTNPSLKSTRQRMRLLNYLPRLVASSAFEARSNRPKQ